MDQQFININLLDAEKMGKEGNVFNILRLLLATMVVFSHSFFLTSGDYSNEPFYRHSAAQCSAGSFGVDMFFLLSGFLITSSWHKHPQVSGFLIKRILRLFPGFVFALIFSLFVGFAWSSAGFYPSTEWVSSVIGDMVTLSNDSLRSPEFFSSNPHPHEVNSSMWTIRLEFTCYLSVMALGLAGLLKKNWVPLVILGATFCFWAHVATSFPSELMISRSRFFVFFFSGMCFWIFRMFIPLNWGMCSFCIIMLLFSARVRPWFLLLFPFLGGYVLLSLGYLLPRNWVAWFQKNDVSYGLYLYAYPLQQALVSMGIVGSWKLFALSLLSALVLASISWFCIEKPALIWLRDNDHVRVIF